MMTWGVHFAAEYNSSYFYGMIIFVFCIVYGFFKSYKNIHALVAQRHMAFMVQNYSLGRKIIKSFCMVIALFFLFISLLRPQWDKKEQTVSQEGRDLMIAIDISRSMLVQDIKPNRLEFAKEKIKKLLYNLSCERVGLIVFSEASFVQCPLTTDYGAFFLFLDQLDVDTIATGTTALDKAIISALQIFESVATRKTKLLVAFTDGDDFSSHLDGVKDRVLQNQLSIFTVGLGTKHGGPIPVLNEHSQQVGWEKDDQGNVIMSCLNEDLLRSLSTQSGGKYFKAVDSDEDIQQLIKAISVFEKDVLEDKSFHAFEEQYPYSIAVSFLFLALEWIL
jgi:Ca-activated chloride channel family protein